MGYCVSDELVAGGGIGATVVIKLSSTDVKHSADKPDLASTNVRRGRYTCLRTMQLLWENMAGESISYILTAAWSIREYFIALRLFEDQ